MKRILSILLLISCAAATYGQLPDTIKFKSGVKVATNIDSVSKAARLIYYHTNQVNQVVSFDIVAYYFFKNEWYVVANESREVSNRFRYTAAKQPPALNRPVQVWLTKPMQGEQNSWRVNWNVSSLLNRNSAGSFVGFQSARLFGFELERALERHWSIKAPIFIALNNSAFEEATNNGVGLVFPDTYDRGFLNLPEFSYYPGQYGSPYGGHYVISNWQAGVHLKFYPLKRSKHTPYVAFGFDIGEGDMGVVVEKHTFSYIDYQWARRWTQTDYSRSTSPSPIEYSRHTLELGIEFNLGDHLSINVEMGMSSKMTNTSTAKDQVYFRVEGDNYTLVHEKEYRPREAYTFIDRYVASGNILIGYRFD